MRLSMILATAGLICGCGASAKAGDVGLKAASGGNAAPPSPAFGPQFAKAADCGALGAADVPNFFRISGTRVPLPANNALARDSTVVQPGNVPIAHYGIGVDDGTGVCAVYMPNPPVPPGGHLSLTVQAVRSTGGGVWFGWVNVSPPPCPQSAPASLPTPSC